MNELTRFLKEPLYKNALASYARVAESHRWYLGDKLKMYNWAKLAFEGNLPEERRRQWFRSIYQELKSYWQIFRNARSGYWSSDETFYALTQKCTACSRERNFSLLTLYPDTVESQEVLNALNSLSNLKPASVYPWMAVSKFTHFFNPKLFPIFDYEVIWKTVLNGAFKEEYRKWCSQHGHNPDNAAAEFNLHYMLWTGHIIRNADDDFMEFFSEWFRKQLVKDIDRFSVLNDISQYYATAFEFVAIGAAELLK